MTDPETVLADEHLPEPEDFIIAFIIAMVLWFLVTH